ncbi:MAG: hypothetical protein ACQSGP_18460 [Frankia sp.]
MAMIPERGPENASRRHRSDVSTLLVVNTADRPQVIPPPTLVDLGYELRPMLHLPGIRVVVDNAHTHTEAVKWWAEASVACLYIGRWHEDRADGGPDLADLPDLSNPLK